MTDSTPKPDAAAAARPDRDQESDVPRVEELTVRVSDLNVPFPTVSRADLAALQKEAS